MKGVYLIHLDQPLGQPQSDDQRAARGLPPRQAGKLHCAQHYIGYADDIYARLRCHQAGEGAHLLAVANQRGIPYRIVRIWPGCTQSTERHLKNYKRAAKFCPICNPDRCWNIGAFA